MLQRGPWRRPACWNSFRPDDCKIPRVATRHVREAFACHNIVVVRWCSAAELTPLRSVRPSYRFLRPRSRENLSPAGTSHFPRPWAGHVRRIRLPDHDTSYPAWPESVDTNTEQSTYKQAERRHSHPRNTLIIRYHLFPAWIFGNFLPVIHTKLYNYL